MDAPRPILKAISVLLICQASRTVRNGRDTSAKRATDKVVQRKAEHHQPPPPPPMEAPAWRLLTAAKVRRWPGVGKEGGALHLLDVVEAGDADEAVGEGEVHARISERTSSGGAAVHGELPHHPVAVVVVARDDGGVEAGPAVGVSVRLSADSNSMQGVQPLLRRYWTWRAISWSERGEEGESLEEPEGEGRKRSRSARCEKKTIAFSRSG